jgi:hypothetical protein
MSMNDWIPYYANNTAGTVLWDGKGTTPQNYIFGLNGGYDTPELRNGILQGSGRVYQVYVGLIGALAKERKSKRK